MDSQTLSSCFLSPLPHAPEPMLAVPHRGHPFLTTDRSKLKEGPVRVSWSLWLRGGTEVWKAPLPFGCHLLGKLGQGNEGWKRNSSLCPWGGSHQLGLNWSSYCVCDRVGTPRRVGDRSKGGKGHSFTLPPLPPALFPALFCRWLPSGLTTVSHPLLDTR